MVRRLIRLLFRLGLLAALGFALAKIVQSRRASSPLGGGSEWSAAPPRRTDAAGRPVGETPLVEPHMLSGVSLKKPDATAPENGQEAAASGQSSKPAAPAARAAAPRRSTKKAATKKAPAKRAAAAKKKSPAKAWVDPDGSICPSSHPIKGKLSSGIFHLPGMTAYERTSPDRCYRDEDSAGADGLRKAKR